MQRSSTLTPLRIHAPSFRRKYAVVLCLLCLWVNSPTQALAELPESSAFQPGKISSLHALERAVAERAPEIRAALREAMLSDAEVEQTHLFNNPELDVSFGTLPLGATNPADLQRPWANVPNYGAGLSYTIPIRKRGPRQREAAALARAARAQVELTTRHMALQLAETLGELATATMRHEGLLALEESSLRSLALSEARLASQFGSGLDVDRSQIDMQRVTQQRLGAENDIREHLSVCSSLVMRPCEAFAEGTAARAYLSGFLRFPERAQAPLTERPDVRALEAQAQAAGAKAELAKAQAIPDPSVRVGYVHDRFLVSGNHRNSLNLSVSVPLPIFDRGQVKQRAAEKAREQLYQEREDRLARARLQSELLFERSRLARSRCLRLTQEVMPQARAVLESLEKAEASRLVSLTEVIQARRTLSELLLDEADSCGDAYDAVLALLREAPRSPHP